MKTMDILTYKRMAEPERGEDKVATSILLAAIGLLAGRVEIWGLVMPTGVGWAIANKRGKRLILAIFAAMSGILLSGADIYKLRSIITLAAVYLIYRSEIENTFLCAVIGATVNFVSGAAIFMVTKSNSFDYILLLIESILIVGSSIAFENATEIINRGGSIINDDEAISVFVVAACISAGFGGIDIAGVTLSAIVSMYMIILCSQRCGIGMAVTLAAVLGVASGGENIITVMGIYIFLAIGCSLLSSVGRWGIAVGAALAVAAFAACKLGSQETFGRVMEISIAASAFYLTPKKTLNFIAEYASRRVDYSPERSHLTRQKVAADSAMEDIEGAVTTVAQIVREMDAETDKINGHLEIMKKVKNGICKDCTLNGYCTGKNRKQTEKAIEYIMRLMEEKGCADAKEVAEVLAWKCIHGDRVVGKVKDSYEFYREQGIYDEKIRRHKEYTIAGLEDMAEIISRQRKRLAQGYETYETMSEDIAESLTRNGVLCGGVCVTREKTGLFEVMAEIESENLGYAEEIIKNVMEVNMKTAAEEKTDRGTVLTLKEREHYKYDVAVLNLDNKNRQTGDTAIWFDDGCGFLHCMVSDGMGSGVEAAKESGWTVKLFEKLSRAGFEPCETFRMVNNVMIAAKSAESCISADAVKINLRSGFAEIIKAGAASSYIKTDKGVEKIGWSSIPLGILEISELETRSVDISAGGYVIMMSDGVPDTAKDRIEGEHNIRKALEECDKVSPREMAEYVMFAAMSAGAPKDDMTIIVVQILKEN
ncbi:MAG: SpoIIE family protein phosphatase [Bacillota bacterium]|nr:SpoIIE family protein phosphatase [Bacillota bacterium]